MVTISEEDVEAWRIERTNARAALRMIRETIETLGPPGALPSEEAVLGLHGPELAHEAEAICQALQRLLLREDEAQALLAGWDEPQGGWRELIIC